MVIEMPHTPGYREQVPAADLVKCTMAERLTCCHEH